jgi:ABC-type uncharacterized transport system substrate-binding protein
MRRRDFIAGFVSSVALPVVAHTQEREAVRLVTVLFPGAADDPVFQSRYGAFLQGMQQAGWAIGRNLRIEVRWANSNVALRKYAAELVQLAPDVIVANGSTAVLPLAQLTRTVPIVFPILTDPVGGGFVESLARPGGNITGFMNFEFGMAGKWLELLKQVTPNLAKAGVLRDPTQGSGTSQFAAIQGIAPTLGIEAVPLNMRDLGEIERVIPAFSRVRNGGIVVTSGAVANRNRTLIIELAARHKLPTVYSERFFVTDGGLISYGPNQVDQFRLAAGYVDRILRGEKPSDLPVQAPSKFETVINLKTAKSLGLIVPPTLLARADEVIE